MVFIKASDLLVKEDYNIGLRIETLLDPMILDEVKIEYVTFFIFSENAFVSFLPDGPFLDIPAHTMTFKKCKR